VASGIGGEGRVPFWVLISAAIAPIVLIGGWTLAASRQPAGFDPLRDTVSALAARGAHDRWLMTTALFGVGICHLVTASGLRTLARPGRSMLALGGAATIAVAALPEPTHGSSAAHGTAAALSFLALTLWPVFAARGAASSVASATLAGLLVWFVVALVTGDWIGLSERVVAGAQSVWILMAAAAAYRAARRREAVTSGTTS
jgi:hypothetical membrane protein